MSVCTSTLFFGITVTVTSLCFTAAAYVHVKPALLGIDLVRARRDKGRLETSSSQGARSVGDVPSEVWQLVKKYLVVEAVADQVDAFVREYDDPSCRCDGCTTRSAHWSMVRGRLPADSPRRFTMDDMYECTVREEAEVDSARFLARSKPVRSVLPPPP